jgi:hypothetical protein
MPTYVMKDNKKLGPFEDQELLGRLREGMFARTDLGWREGMADWKPLGELYPEHEHKLHLKELPKDAAHKENPTDPNSHVWRFIVDQLGSGAKPPDIIKKLVEMGVDEQIARPLVNRLHLEIGGP